MPRKNLRGPRKKIEALRSFNEAAARCRGKPLRPFRRAPAPRRRFNEAAARCRGKPEGPTDLLPDSDTASMRPRPDAAENLGAGLRFEDHESGFNEAAARCRGKPARADSRNTSISRLQ